MSSAVSLPVDIDRMRQRQIKKHHVAILLLHWFNASVWLFELVTGVALVSSPHFQVAPGWFLDLVAGIFGPRANLLRFHIALGLTWITVFLVYGVFGFRTYLSREVLQREVALDADDWAWLRIRLLRILGRSREPLPPQGVYNAGQKLFALMVYLMIPLVMFSGLVMTFHWFGPQAVAWAIVLHFAAVGAVVSGLMIHVYMGAVFPEEKPAFFSMITGNVNEYFAYRHHVKWWKEVKMAEQAWEAGRPEAAAAAPPAPAADAGSLWQRVFRSSAYWPPYAAGTGLGLTLLASFVVLGDGLGASGAFTRYVTAAVAWLAPAYAAANPYWSTYLDSGQSPLLDNLVFELIGVAIGGFVSGWLAHRVKFTVDKGPRISTRTRYALALGGGILTGIGARLARGCTSGLALSGGAVLSVGAFVFMMCVFGAGYFGAWLLRRYWL
jgi:formate dehydrogenase gamma subunit